MRLTRILFALALTALLAMPARATELLDMDINIGRQILARGLCKTPAEVNYVAKVQDNIYLFSVFYAQKEARFFVGVYKDIIRVQGKDFRNITRTIPYTFDDTSKCAVIEYSVPDCPTNERIVCCSEKTIEEKLDDKFWDKTIPELLEEDLQNAIKSGNPAQPQGTDNGTTQGQEQGQGQPQ